MAEAARAEGTVSSDILSHRQMAEAARAGGTVSSDILSHRQMAEAARAGGTSLFGNPVRGNVVPPARSLRISSRIAYWLRRYALEALSHRIYSRTDRWLSRYVPEARHFSVTRYATQERAGTVHLQAVSVPEVRYYPRLFRNYYCPLNINSSSPTR